MRDGVREKGLLRKKVYDRATWRRICDLKIGALCRKEGDGNGGIREEGEGNT